MHDENLLYLSKWTKDESIKTRFTSTPVLPECELQEEWRIRWENYSVSDFSSGKVV